MRCSILQSAVCLGVQRIERTAILKKVKGATIELQDCRAIRAKRID